MIEANNPDINVDELMKQVRAEAARRRPNAITGGAEFSDSAVSTANSYIEALLNNAETKSQVRSEIPQKIARFFVSKRLQEFVLKVYAFLFKDQRAVNFSLIQALRESLILNQKLVVQVTTLQSRLDKIGDRLTATESRLTATNEHYLRNDTFLKNDLTQQKRLITLFLEEARKRLPEPFNQERLQTFVNEDQHLLDAFYVAFEEQFRGSREHIRNRMKVYLPLLEKVKVSTPELPILDVGCGRGEWLELLREAGYTAKGLDLNRVMVDDCQARGLHVVAGDVIPYLQNLPDFSLSAVTGFHLIEHLSFPALLQLLQEVVRVLKSGGLAIFETPNPKNLVVGACNFYSDPTHQHPVFPETIQFVVESQGLSNVQLLYLNPVEGSPFAKDDAGSQQLHNWFFGPRDYAVIGRKL